MLARARSLAGQIDPVVRLALARASLPGALSQRQLQAQQQPAWVINAITGSDGAAGVSSGTALQTIGELFRRWGTLTPILRQSTTITFETDMPASDPWLAVPFLIGAGGLHLQGTFTPLAPPTALATYTPANFIAGTRGMISVAGPAGFFAPLVGCIVRDVTAGATFVIDQNLGAASAAISAPYAFPLAEFPSGIATLTPGDTLTFLQPSRLFSPAIDFTSLGTLAGGGATLDALRLSADAEQVLGLQWQVRECQFDVLLLLSRTLGGTNVASVLLGCYVFHPCAITAIVCGGAFAGAGNNFQAGSVLDGDVIIDLRVHGSGPIQLRRVYFGQTNDVDNFPVQWQMELSNVSVGACRIWGPGTLNVFGGSTLRNDVGPFVASLLGAGGTALIDGASSAVGYDPATRLFTPAVAITAANLDASPSRSLLNPATGSKIFQP